MAIATPPDDLSEIPDGTPLAAIAARYGVTVAIARRWLTAEGRPPVTRVTGRPGGPPRLYDTARIVKLYAEGRTEVEVAAEVGCSATTVSKYVRVAGLGRGRVLPRLDSAEIVRRYQAGQSLTKVAAAVGASMSGVWGVLVRAGVPRRPRESRGQGHGQPGVDGPSGRSGRRQRSSQGLRARRRDDRHGEQLLNGR